MSRRLKILISAYACNPLRGSEPGTGWGWISALSQHHDLWVITKQEDYPDIQAELTRRPQLRAHVQFFAIPRRRCTRLERLWPPSYYWTYKRWHKQAYRLAQQLHHEIGFDLVHQLNMVGFREPGYLWQLNVPFVWGPVGGFGLLPWHFLSSLGFAGAVYHIGRNCMNRLHQVFLRRPTLAARRTEGRLIAATTETANAIQRFFGSPSHRICEVGPPSIESTPIHDRHPDEPLRIIWSGLHVTRKGLPLLLRALKRLPVEVSWSLDVLGTGPRTVAWQRLAQRLGVNDRCRWHGWLPRDRALAVMQRGHVFALSSLLDLTSTVLIEALACGLPVVCLEHCGFTDVVTPECGLTIAVHYPRQVITDFAIAFRRLFEDEPYRRRLAEGSHRRAQAFTWKSKIAQLNGLYAEAVGESWIAHPPHQEKQQALCRLA